MRNGMSSFPDKGTSPDHRKRIITSLDGLSSIRKESPRHPLEASPPNTRDTRKYSAKKNRKDYLDTLFGITPSSCSQEHLPHYLDDSSLSLKVKSLKHKNL